jgi:hypothetical protein
MSSTDTRSSEPKPVEKDYVEIIKSDVKVDKQYVSETGIAARIVYYCRDCKKLVRPERVGKKFKFKCTDCKGENVAFGSEQSIRNFYRLPEEKTESKPVL